MDDIFGGSTSTSTSEGHATSTPKDLTPKPYRRLQGPFANLLRGLMGQIKGGTGLFGSQEDATLAGQQGGDTLGVPTTANENELLQNLMGDARNNERGKYLSDVLGGKYLPGQEGSNPFLQAAIEAAQRPTLQGLTETLGRTLPGRFTQAGQFINPQGSSAFDRAAAIATRGASQTLGDIATNISSQNFEGERNRQQEAAKISQEEVQTTIANLQAQGLPRLIQQHGVELGLKAFQDRMAAVLDVLKTISGTTQPTVANQAQSDSSSNAESETKPNIFSSLFPAGA